MSGQRHFDVAARTHPGRVRLVNEDCLLIDAARGWFAVIDGMGGSAGGGVAANLARNALATSKGDLVAAFTSANEGIRADARAHPERAGMGAVLTAAAIGRSTIGLAHVGDTRAYLASALGIEQLTRDHTAVAERQEALALTDAQAAGLRQQHAVTRDVGRADQIDHSWVETSTVPFATGDVLLLCSDGLHDVVRSPELFSALNRARNERLAPNVLADQLLKLALARGGPDNITLIVVRRRMDSTLKRWFSALRLTGS